MNYLVALKKITQETCRTLTNHTSFFPKTDKSYLYYKYSVFCYSDEMLRQFRRGDNTQPTIKNDDRDFRECRKSIDQVNHH